MDFLSGPMVKKLPANAEDTSWVSGLEQSHTLQGNQVRAPQLLIWRSETRDVTTMRNLHASTREGPPARHN